jgi:hypothetical protein
VGLFDEQILHGSPGAGISEDPRQARIGPVPAVLGRVYLAGAIFLHSRILGTQPPVFVAGATLAAAGTHPELAAVWVKDGAS